MPTLPSWFSFTHLIVLSVVLRVILLLYGEWQDANMTVKYTDIDYVVFTDAARFVLQGGSPYDRATYRYTPLLAFILTPNLLIHPSFGKWLFALADIGVGALLHGILVRRGMPAQRALWFDALWLLNPMVANISTRGNAESLLALMVLGALYLVLVRRFYPACALFGLAVHFKIYPVIYAVPLVCLLDHDRYGDYLRPGILQSYQQGRLYLLHNALPRLALRWDVPTMKDDDDNNKTTTTTTERSIRYWLVEGARQCVLFLSPTRIMFGLCSGGVFFALTWAMYQW
jgi:phosphatidylinositol glycan class M